LIYASDKPPKQEDFFMEKTGFLTGKLLFNSPPLVVNRELAGLIGLNEAIVLQQLHYWIENNRTADRNNREGFCWTYNSIKNWQASDFPFWSFDTVKRTFASLERKGLLITGNFNRLKLDQTKWYRIDYEALETLISPISAKCPNAEMQNAPMQEGILPQPIPEIYTENNVHIQSQGQRQTMTIDNDTDPTARVSEIVSKDKPPAVKDKADTPKEAPRKETLHENAPKHNYSHYHAYKEIIQNNIDYDFIFKNQQEQDLADSLIETMLDVILTESPNTVKIGKETKSRDIVKAVYLKLNGEHIQHVIDQYKAQHHQITYKTAYLRTMLYTVYQELEAWATNQVRADGVVW
jgi:hypothetical protein